MNSVRTTQEGVSALIGVSRPVVSTLIDWLGSRGVVRHERGNITVILAKELEGLACECFRSIETAREEYLATLERMGKKGAQASSADDENPVNSVRHG